MLKSENISNSIMKNLTESSLKEDENEKEYEDKYRKALSRFIQLTNDDAFKIGEYGALTIPNSREEKSFMITRIQEIEDCLEDLKGIVM